MFIFVDRLVPIIETGWKSFDVSQAIHYWSKTQRKTPLYLEVWIEGERPGSHAAEMAKCVHFATQDPADKTLGKPELVLYTLNLEEYGYVLLCSILKVSYIALSNILGVNHVSKWH